MRERYFAVERIRTEIADDAPRARVDVGTFTLRLLIEAPSLADMKILVSECTKQAMVAGDVLAALYVMDRFKIPEPSMNKAVFCAQEYAKKAKTYGDGTPLAISEAKIRQYWSKYRSVAHFWAASRLEESYPFVQQDQLFSRGHFQKFLEVSQDIYFFGCAFIPKRAKPQEPILKHGECWALPDEIQPKQLSSTKEPAHLMKYLQKYKAAKT